MLSYLIAILNNLIDRKCVRNDKDNKDNLKKYKETKSIENLIYFYEKIQHMTGDNV